MPRYVCVTGAAGFIGAHVVEAFAKRGDYVYAVDAMTYAAQPDVLSAIAAAYAPRVHIRPVDVRTLTRLPDVDTVVHLAASTHVDNSLSEAAEFVANNVGSTAHMLELVRAKAQHGMPHYVHISTDEVYGSIASGAAAEDAPLCPSSPYAASKAAADMLVLAWAHTYDIPSVIVRPTNCFGQTQHPEKLIPKTVRNCVLGRPMTVHGDGTQTRQWLHVADLVNAIMLVVDKQLSGVYNVGGAIEASVLDVVARIRNEFDAVIPEATLGYARAGADERYSVNDSKLRSEGWTPQGILWDHLPHIVATDRTRFRF